jgi:predicted tellurium resistance membrane protein TerC
MEILSQPEVWIALATLTALEIVLGIDNIIFISILVGNLPEKQRQRARILGLSLAMVSRLLLLFTLTFIMGLTKPLFTLFSFGFSGRDLILIFGGLFLLAKSTHEIHSSLEVSEHEKQSARASSFMKVLIQIAIIDIVFSLDSVITAVGLVKQIPVMVAAIVISVVVMMIAAKPLGEFVDDHPTIKMLALSFLILVGVALFAEGVGFHIPKGYIYFAMAFSVGVEMINIKLRSKMGKPLKLNKQL